MLFDKFYILFVGSVLYFFYLSVLQRPSKPKLIYIMLDGFRYDYVDDQPAEDLPGFSKLLQNGVRAEYMTPVYPSLSYPNWMTLVTGLWTESHGIVGNYFYDPQQKDNFSFLIGETTSKEKWWTAEPVWATATKAGVKTGVFFWGRCDIPYDGIKPKYCKPFVEIEGPEIFKLTIKMAVGMLFEGYDFIQIYSEHTDDIGRKFGPETEERRKAVRDLDRTILYLLETLEKLEISDQVNIIIVSDHGMATTSPETVQRVELDDYLLTDYVENVADAGAFSNIKVKEGYVDQVYETLKSMPGVQVYRHDEIPDDLHFKNNKYIHDIILKADNTTYIMKSRSVVQISPRNDTVTDYGAHGYDPNEEENMRGIFFASGPDFRKGYVMPPIQTVDVYPLITHLLQVEPRPNNGTFSHVKMALQEPYADDPTKNISTHPAEFFITNWTSSDFFTNYSSTIKLDSNPDKDGPHLQNVIQTSPFPDSILTDTTTNELEDSISSNGGEIQYFGQANQTPYFFTAEPLESKGTFRAGSAPTFMYSLMIAIVSYFSYHFSNL